MTTVPLMTGLVRALCVHSNMILEGLFMLVILHRLTLGSRQGGSDSKVSSSPEEA